MHFNALHELDIVRDQCRALVTRRASLSAGAAVIPLPGIDIGTDIAILLRLLPTINRKFGLSLEQISALDPETKKLVMVLVSAVGSELVGRAVSKEIVLKLLKKIGIQVTTKTASKFIPVVGQAFSAGISFAAMKMLGNAHVDDCYEIARRALVARGAVAQATIESGVQTLSPT